MPAAPANVCFWGQSSDPEGRNSNEDDSPGRRRRDGRQQRVRAGTAVRDGRDDGAFRTSIEIYVRNKRPAKMTSFRPERTVLIVHGATYPASTSYDLPFDGLSWVDYIAARGYDVYLLDVRGYGRSTRPKEMDQRPDANPPIARGTDAVKDVGAAVDFILKRRDIPRLNLLGHSWGTVLMATYSTQQPAKVERLVLYAPVWVRQTASLIQTGPGPLGAYRTVTAEQARARRLVGVPENKKAALFSSAWFEAWE